MERYLDDQYKHWTIHAGLIPPTKQEGPAHRPGLATTFNTEPEFVRRMSQAFVSKVIVNGIS